MNLTELYLTKTAGKIKDFLGHVTGKTHREAKRQHKLDADAMVEAGNRWHDEAIRTNMFSNVSHNKGIPWADEINRYNEHMEGIARAKHKAHIDMSRESGYAERAAALLKKRARIRSAIGAGLLAGAGYRIHKYRKHDQ